MVDVDRDPLLVKTENVQTISFLRLLSVSSRRDLSSSLLKLIKFFQTWNGGRRGVVT